MTAADTTEDHEVCTGCGSEGFVTILGNGDPADAFNGPYTLCAEAYKTYLKEGDDVLYTHD